MFEDVEEGYFEGEKENRIKFLYNREERIAKAPQNVQDYYKGGMRPQTGLKIFYKNKSNRFILITLLFFVAFIWIYNSLNNNRNTCKIENMYFELQAFHFEEEIFVTLKAKPNSKSKEVIFYNTPIQVEFLFINNDNTLFQKEQIAETLSTEEKNIRTRITDYDIIRVDAVIKINDTEKELVSFVKR